jgi:hypothetical protein
VQLFRFWHQFGRLYARQKKFKKMYPGLARGMSMRYIMIKKER